MPHAYAGWLVRTLLLAAATSLVVAPATAAPASTRIVVAASPVAPPPGTAPAAPAAEAERVGFGLVPATSEALDYRAYLVYGLTPGSVAYDHIGLVNYSTDPLSLQVYASDAEAPAAGGFALAAASSPPQDLGAWIGIEGGGSVEVPGRDGNGQPGTVILPVTITVPADAEPGDHAGGIVASLDTVGQNPDGQNIELQQRVASRVYVQVGGRIAPELSITGIEADYVPPARPWRPGSVELSYTVANTGNLRLGFEPTATVSGPVGTLSRSRGSDTVEELLPGSSVDIRVTVPDVWPIVRAGVRVTANPLAAPVAADPGLTPVRAERTIWAITRDMAAALALLALLLALPVVRSLLTVRRDRRAAKLQITPAVPLHQREPVP